MQGCILHTDNSSKYLSIGFALVHKYISFQWGRLGEHGIINCDKYGCASSSLTTQLVDGTTWLLYCQTDKLISAGRGWFFVFYTDL